MRIFRTFLFIVFVFSSSQVFADYNKLTKGNYKEFKDKKAIILYGINWGREWGCCGFDNAQLLNLTFSYIGPKLDKSNKRNIVLSPKGLFKENVYRSYAIMIDPGEYALTGFHIKVAKSLSDVAHMRVEAKDLVEDGKYFGGTFEASPGEIVYIGDFGLDCVGSEPMLWRYYIHQEEDFHSYVSGFKEKYKFIGDKPVMYRLFQTDKFGQ